MKFLYEFEDEKLEYKVTKEEFTIGRSDDCDFTIPDSSISKVHARCTIEGDELLLRDLDSRNGTKINGRKIIENYLEDRDVVEVGSLKLFFLAEGEVGKESGIREISLGGMTSELILKVQAKSLRKKFSFTNRKITIGSNEENDICLQEPGVSRFHAEVHPTPEGAWIIRDLGSRNGTLVNGILVESQPLSKGDKVQIGAAIINVKTRVIKARSKKAGATEGQGPLQNPVILGLLGFIVIMLVAAMMFQKNPETEENQNANPELTKKFHSNLEQGIKLFRKGNWQQAEDKFRKISNHYEKSELAQCLRNLVSLWNKFRDNIFSFEEWKKFNSEMDHLSICSAAYKKHWENQTLLPYFSKNLKSKMNLERKGAEVYLEAQNLLETKSYEASYKKFQEIPHKSLYWVRGQAFIDDNQLLRKIIYQYVEKAKEFEREAYLDRQKYIAANALYRKLIRRYSKEKRGLEEAVQKRIAENKLNMSSLSEYLKARNALTKEKDYAKALEYAKRVNRQSKYWKGTRGEGARAIIASCKIHLQFKKAENLYQKGSGKQALRILERLSRQGFQDARKLKKRVEKVLKYMEKARQAERADSPFEAKNYYAKVYKIESDSTNRYHQLASQEESRLQRKVKEDARAFYRKGMEYFEKENFGGALEYFDRCRDIDEKRKYYIQIRNAIRQNDVILYKKAKNWQFSTHAFHWKQAKPVYLLLIRYLPQDSSIRDKSKAKLKRLKEKIAEWKRQQALKKQKNKP